MTIDELLAEVARTRSEFVQAGAAVVDAITHGEQSPELAAAAATFADCMDVVGKAMQILAADVRAQQKRRQNRRGLN